MQRIVFVRFAFFRGEWVEKAGFGGEWSVVYAVKLVVGLDKWVVWWVE
jgi:hypothetical protein